MKAMSSTATWVFT